MFEQKRTFKPEHYLNEYYSTTQGNLEEQMENVQQKWGCEAFQIIPQSQTCIQLGCGPSLNLAACASRKCKNIFLTEYNVECFSPIISQLTKNSANQKSFWGERFQIIADIEGTTEKQVEKRLRQRVVACFKCDLTQDNILVGVQYFKKVDVIVSSLAMQSASKVDEDYTKIVRNIKKLLKSNGYIYFFGVLQGSFYTVNGEKLPTIRLNESKIKQALDENDFEIIKLNLKKNENLTQVDVDNQGFFSVLAKSKN